jgi:hypothetical protein
MWCAVAELGCGPLGRRQVLLLLLPLLLLLVHLEGVTLGQQLLVLGGSSFHHGWPCRLHVSAVVLRDWYCRF